MPESVAQGYNVRPDKDFAKPRERKIPYSGSSENNPYYDDTRKINRNFVIVQSDLYENDAMEQYIMNTEKLRFLLKIIFIGLIALGYALL